MKNLGKNKKKKKKKSQTGSTFNDVFLGETVRVITKHQLTQSASNGEMVESITSNLAFDGVLLETDDDYLYLAVEGDTINSAVKKSDIVNISVGQVNDLADILLDRATEGKVLN